MLNHDFKFENDKSINNLYLNNYIFNWFSNVAVYCFEILTTHKKMSQI